ncbi:MAG: hypothetical protein GX363_01975 [Clostridiales bacterium]|jgi:hypothetical protein|nr:hypothetical protein [Clostridiales bacterium]
MYDLLGLYLDDAIKILSSKGLKWEITETGPVKKMQDGYLRIIKQELSEDKYLLTLCKIPDAYRKDG